MPMLLMGVMVDESDGRPIMSLGDGNLHEG